MSRAGQASAVGDVFRAEAATHIAVYSLAGQDLPDLALRPGAIARRIEFETEDSTDDICVSFSDGTRAFISAKRACGNDAAFRDTVEGWVDQLSSMNRNDVLVLAVEDLRGDVKQLGSALARLRAGQELVRTAELKAIVALDAQVPEDQRAEVRRRARVMFMPHSTTSELGRSLLQSILRYVLRDGDAHAALAVLGDEMSRQAGQAAASTVDDWVATLRAAGFEVLADHVGPAGMQAAARAVALAHYRTALLADAGRIDLTLLAEDLPPVVVSDLLDGLRVKRADTDRSTEEPLMRFVRRWRRLLFVGQPGAGKSVALREIAVACLENPAAPTPIRLALNKLLDHHPGPLPSDALLVSALESVAEASRPALASELADALTDGTALLLCDGLDECGSRAGWVASRLAETLGECHPNTGLLVATRGNAVTAAQHLELPRLDLQPPKNLDSTLQAVLEACATSRVPANERDAWIEGRTSWLSDAREQHGDLLEVPLLAVLATLTCADTPAAQLPHHRALVLHEAVRQSVDRWEQSRGSGDDARQWSPDLSADLLLGGFIELGRLLDGAAAPSRAEVNESLAAWLRDDWGQPPARARETARDVIRFWDDRVAVFVFDAADRLRSRSKVFAEIATAMWAQTCTSEQRMDWLRQTVRWTDSDGAIALAAGLAVETTDALLDLGESVDEAALLAAELAAEGSVLLSPADARRCIAQLARQVAAFDDGGTIATRRAKDGSELLERIQDRRSLEPTWELVELACRLSLPTDDRAERDQLVAAAGLQSESATIASALAALTDAATEGRNLSSEERGLIRDVVAIPLPPETEMVQKSRRLMSFVTGDPAHPGLAPIALLAAHHLDELDPSVARWIFDVSMECAYGRGTPIRQALRDAGVDTAPWWRETWRFNLAGIVAEARDHERLLLEDIAFLDSTLDFDAADSTLWSLQAVGDLILVSDYPEQGVRDMRAAFEDDSTDLRRRWLDALCDAYRLSKALAAAQARYLLDKPHLNDDSLLSPREDWRVATATRPSGDTHPVLEATSISHVQQETLLEALFAASDWLALPAADVLVNVPRPVWDGAELASRDVKDLHRGRAMVIIALGILTSGENAQQLTEAAARSEDADQRLAARKAISMRPRLDTDGELKAELSRDPDLAVRYKSERRLDPPCVYWSCGVCRTRNDLDVEDCPGCMSGTRPEL